MFTSAQASGDGIESRLLAPEIAPASSVDIDMPLQASAQRALEPAATPMGMRPDAPQVSAANAIVDLPPNGGLARREPKITIGQIDVQVINTPAPVQVPAVPANAGESKGFMSAELDRFRWRLR